MQVAFIQLSHSKVPAGTIGYFNDHAEDLIALNNGEVISIPLFLLKEVRKGAIINLLKISEVSEPVIEVEETIVETEEMSETGKPKARKPRTKKVEVVSEKHMEG